jgi:hypothetical protein
LAREGEINIRDFANRCLVGYAVLKPLDLFRAREDVELIFVRDYHLSGSGPK